MDDPPGDARFATTRWSLVARAGADEEASRAALDELCRQYWEPLYAFLRRRGERAEEAQDLVQGFFGHLLERRGLEALEPGGGRFRSFLAKSLQNWVADRRDHDRAARRGGGRPVFSLDAASAAAAERRYVSEAGGATTPEEHFTRRWAWTLIDATVERLAAEYAARGRQEVFRSLRPHLDPTADEVPYAEKALQLGMSEGALKVAVHRLRGRFRDLFRREVAETLDDRSAVDEEIAALLGAFRR